MCMTKHLLSVCTLLCILRNNAPDNPDNPSKPWNGAKQATQGGVAFQTLPERSTQELFGLLLRNLC